MALISRQKHTPTTELRSEVQRLAGFGMRQKEIAIHLGLNPSTLRKYYADDMMMGPALNNLKMAESLYEKALGTGAGAVTAAIFWLKHRGGWQDGPNASTNAIQGQGARQSNDLKDLLLDENTPAALLVAKMRDIERFHELAKLEYDQV